MLVALYEQNRSLLSPGHEGRSFKDVFRDGSTWGRFATIHDMQSENSERDVYDIEEEGAHPNFLHGWGVDQSSSLRSTEQIPVAPLKEIS